MATPSEQDVRTRHAERLADIATRETALWREYLAAARTGDAALSRAEAFAWRRLRRLLAGLAAERRQAVYALERDLAAGSDRLPHAS